MSDMQQSAATLSCYTLLLNEVACLTSQVVQPLTNRATKLLDRNHLLFFGNFLACRRAVIGQLFVYMPMNFSYAFYNIHLTPQTER